MLEIGEHICKKKIERVFIRYEKYPDWDYVINIFLDIADKLNEIIDRLNEEEK